MKQPFVQPELKKTAFNCPRCSAYAKQFWFDAHIHNNGWSNLGNLKVSWCAHCNQTAYWFEDRILIPETTIAPPANDDLPPDIAADYTEAASIVARSPRGSSALLRLCLQKLCGHLGEGGKDINNDIGNLVKKGLDARIQKALDTVRVIGNEAVHPGEMDLKDDAEIAGQLFILVNAIANDMITQPRLRDALYAKLPQSKLAGIAVRDSKKPAV